MIMAHAPVIFPAVLRRPLPYHPVMYAPAALLHASLVLRLAVGDARDVEWAVQVGGVANIVAVLAFVAIAAWSVITARPTAPGRTTRAAAPRTPQTAKPRTTQAAAPRTTQTAEPRTAATAAPVTAEGAHP